jgi:mannosylglycerate hydrolase
LTDLLPAPVGHSSPDTWHSVSTSVPDAADDRAVHDRAADDRAADDRAATDDPVAGYHFTVVPHTHWDREWYLPFEVFRLRLVRAVEEICGVLERETTFRTFTLDGQSVILEDVTELRPDLEPRMRRLLADGRLSTGPAYVLPDEFLAGQETLVRNFIVGIEVCRRFGAEPMGVGYMPDPFGHVAQLPQILRGFGLDAFIFWRGLGDEANRFGLAFTWEAPDGTSVTAIRQLGSYGNASGLGRWAEGGVDLDDRPELQRAAASGRFERFVRNFAVELERTATTELFLCNGSDHTGIDPTLPELLEHARAEHPATGIAIGSYDDYWKRVAPTLRALPVHRGELVSGRDAPVLRGINSTRMPLKQAAERTERAILVAEALASLAVMAQRTPYAYPAAAFDRAWREHLRNMPHDSISGCHVDEVAADMRPRFAIAQQLAARVQREALASLAGDSEPYSYRPLSRAMATVVNPLGHARHALASIPLPPQLVDEPRLVAVGTDGRRLTVQVDRDGTEASALVGLGLAGFGARELRLVPGASVEIAPAIAVGSDTVANDLVSVAANRDGSVSITDRHSGDVHHGLHGFEDVADRGDEYNFCPLEGDVPVFAGDAATIRVVRRGPLVAELEIGLVLRVPAQLAMDRRRREGEEQIPVTTRVRVSAGSDRVEFTTALDNRPRDHRLRVRFAAAGASFDSTVRAEGHFGVVRRPVRPMWTGGGWVEPPALTAHTPGAVAVGQLTLFGRGLPEYEAIPTRDGLDVALTLLRCVGWLSRDDLATRSGGAGPTIATPGAQCLGTHTFEYAVAVGRVRTDGELLRESSEYRTPVVVGPAGIRTDELLAVRGDVLVTTLKGAQDGDDVVLRVVAASPTSLEVDTPFVSTPARLDESPLVGEADGPLRNGEIRTVRLTRRSGTGRSDQA